MSVIRPRFLAPKGHLRPLIHCSHVSGASRTAHLRVPQCRYASADAVPKTIRLEKPAKFVPPSHGKRLKQHVPRHYGPELTQTQKTEQATKKYPNMMPSPGSFMHWFLTNRSIHSSISLGILVLLAAITAYENWKQASDFREQLPSAGDFLSRPLTSCSRAFEVYRLHIARTSYETAEMRKMDVEDVQKRSTYRRAHGLESDNIENDGWFAWTARSDKETPGPSLKADGPVSRRPATAVPEKPTESGTIEAGGENSKPTYADWEGKKKPLKKWFGIW